MAIQPSLKSPAMERFIGMSFEMFRGISRLGAINLQLCISCLMPAKDFSDDLHEREYTISALCERCQDEVFGVSR